MTPPSIAQGPSRLSESQRDPAGSFLAWAVRALWFVVAPAVLAGFSVTFLIPARMAADANSAWGTLARAAADLTVPAAVALFLIFALMARIWRASLPGARHLAEARGLLDGKTPHGGASLARTGTLILLAGLACIGALVLRGSVVGAFRVVSTSMLPTIDVGDRIVVDKLAYGFRLPLADRPASAVPVRRGDVVVFQANAARGGPTQLVKRVIGVPGDHVTMAGGRPVINGWQVPACDAGLFVYLGRGGELLRGRLLVEFLDDSVHLVTIEPMLERFAGHTVGADEVFVLGDNRGQSADSRILGLSTGQGSGIPLSAIEGRVNRILFGVGRDGAVDWERVWERLKLDVHLPGLDARDLRQGIQKCLSNRPPSIPPPPVAATLTAGSRT